MGITVSGGRKGALSEPNVVPLIDILLVLIIIFMAITPLTPRGLDALVPQPSPENVQIQTPVTTIVVSIECVDSACRHTRVKINQDEVDWGSLGPRLEEIFKTRAEKVAFVKGADDLHFKEVARAIDIAKGSGVDKIGLITAKIEAGQ